MSTIIVINKGKYEKEHRFKWVGAEEESKILRKQGKKSVEPIGDGYALYRYVYRCQCGAMIIEERGNVL